MQPLLRVFLGMAFPREKSHTSTSGFAAQAGGVVSEWAEYAGETADKVKEVISEAGITVKVTADQLGTATVDKVADLMHFASSNGHFCGTERTRSGVSGHQLNCSWLILVRSV